MYTEENLRGRFPLRDILLKAIVVIIFLILIIFIITKVTLKNNETSDVSSSYDEVFSENLKTMEEAAYLYFTTDKLPEDVGDVSKLTLREMINSNLIEAFTDSNGNACDVSESYIRLTKNTEDYTLRVNLKCDEKEDYTLTKVGEYDYCEYDICEEDSSKESTSEDDEDESEDTEEVDITESDTSSSTSQSQNSSYSGSTNSSSSSNTNTTSSGSTSSSSNNSSQQTTVMYEYKKVTSPVLSSWSSWSSWAYNTNKYSAIVCSDTDATCLKEIQLYSRREKVGTDSNGNAVYGTVNYYSTRTRTLISSGSTDTKWSTYNDTSLLNQGYTYTGNVK